MSLATPCCRGFLDWKNALLQVINQIHDDFPFPTSSVSPGECNYGGRVTDDKDRRLLLSLLSTFYCKEIEQDHYYLAPGETYYIPLYGSYQVISEGLRSLHVLGGYRVAKES